MDSEGQLIGAENRIALPAGFFIDRLGRCVGELSGKHEPDGADASAVVGGAIEQRSSRAMAAGFGRHEQVVEDENPRHGARGKAG